MVIRPTRGWLTLNIAELWQYRDLLFLLVYRDFAARYKQTILGPAWFVLQPLLTALVFTVIFGGVAKIPTDGAPPVLFYLAGLLGWSYFAQTLQGTSGTFIANANLFGKVYFPRLIVPLSLVASNLLAFALQLAMFLCFWAYYKFLTPAGAAFGMTGAVLFLPLVVLQVAAASLGVGIWVSASTAKYRDFSHLVGFLVQVWLYATPVIYPLSQIPERWRWLFVLNPMTMPVETIKSMFLGRGLLAAGDIALSAAVTVAVLVSGVLVFNRVEKTFVDTI